MLFSSITFLYWFLPALLVLYFLIKPIKAKNIVLLTGSLLFYFWGEPKYTLLMLFSILSGYVHGLLIHRWKGTAKSKWALVSSIVVSLGLLGVFKYADFFLSTLNSVFRADIPLLKLALPIGISFYTFQLLSYTIDLYRGETKLQRNPLTLATYVALFPQLIAGPIVRYSTVAAELEHREHTLEGFASGAFRFAVGLGKKVLLANTLGELCSIFKASGERTVLFYWLYAIAFALHLYFDFSGYSDMAIGLGRIFGFTFLENFNYPFISKSVSEFWRRWHISLGSWFRDYVYIPLGGNRCSTPRWLFNILVVWFLTGLWHGAGWTFMAWGVLFAILLAAEKLFLAKWLNKAPGFIGHVYTMLVVFVSFVIFDADTLTQAFVRIGGLFGGGTSALWGTESLYYLKSYAVLLILGIVGCTPLIKTLCDRLYARQGGIGTAMRVLRPAALALLLLCCTAYLVDGSFNPFIYFRF